MEEYSTPVPFPSEEVKLLAHTLNGFIVWPRRLVLETPQEAPPRRSSVPKVIKSFVHCFYILRFPRIYN